MLPPSPMATMTDAPFQPLLIHSRGEIAEAVQTRRELLGMTCEDVDALAGFSERYTNKLESPEARCGKRGFYIDPARDRAACSFMAEVWLQTMGLALVLVSAEQAQALGAVPAPPPRQKRKSGPAPKVRPDAMRDLAA